MQPTASSSFRWPPNETATVPPCCCRRAIRRSRSRDPRAWSSVYAPPQLGVHEFYGEYTMNDSTASFVEVVPMFSNANRGVAVTST